MTLNLTLLNKVKSEDASFREEVTEFSEGKNNWDIPMDWSFRVFPNHLGNGT